MISINFKSQSRHYDLTEEFEEKLVEFVKSLDASTDGTAYNLRKRSHIALVEQYVEEHLSSNS